MTNPEANQFGPYSPGMSNRTIGQIVPIADRVLAFWSYDCFAETRQFLDSLDPEYFSVTANALAKLDGSKEEQFAAMHIRMMRDQATEMLFALLGAAVQAPRGAVLWLLSYRTEELIAVVEAFGHKKPLRTVAGTRSLGWDDVAFDVTRHFTTADSSRLDEYRKDHATFWRRLAGQFLDPLARREYASLKHGLRVRPGGCEISIHRETSPGLTDPNAVPIVLQGSGFGSGFYVAERIGTQKLHHRLVYQHRHWTPSSLLLQLDLVVNAAQNVIRHLQMLNGAKGPIRWTRPVGERLFEECWRNDGGLLQSSISTNIEEQDIDCMTEEEMVARCEKPVLERPKG